MGVLLMIFTPVPYMDATSSWGFRSRWKRILVGAAGMIVEVFVAAIAVFVWAETAPGTLHNLCYNMLFIASVSTVLFNINPLLRFDGYYILSDLLDIPNLHQRAAKHLRYLGERYLFGVKRAESPARSARERFWLTTFGIASWIYRIFVFGMILLLVADRFLLLGILMAIVCLISWIVTPTVKFVQYLSSSPVLDRCRPRAVAVSLGFLIIVIGFLQFVPMPNHFRAPGIIQAQQRTEVLNETAGLLEEILVAPGSRVTQGQPIMRLVNQELTLDLQATATRLQETEARLRQARQESTANIKPMQSRYEAVSERLHKLERDEANLTIRARHDGIWVAPNVDDFIGRWLPRGTRLGLMIDPSEFEFISTLKQEDCDAPFRRQILGAEIRLFGQVASVLKATDLKVIEIEQRNLPSRALGWQGGGEVQVSTEDPQGRQTIEPFYEVQAKLPSEVDVVLFHGRSGKIRFDLEPEPLLPRWMRRLMQLLQKRYQI